MRTCTVCTTPLRQRNKTGLCLAHYRVRDRTGMNGRPILDASSQATGIKAHRIIGPEQFQPIVDARAVAAVALYRAGLTMAGIGKMMARDHSTISHLVREFDRRCVKRPHLRDALDRVLAA